ncbi:MAG: hypothetical protein Cons2KO_33160 [Congregibacter sp.]
MHQDLSREELFALVWEKSVLQIAKELGVSDVAIHKRCAKLQVPTPPRGYWAKVDAGKRPAKPALRAYSELVAKRLKKQQRAKSADERYVRLSPLQLEFFKRALAFSGRDLADDKDMRVSRTGAQRVSGELAAELVLIVQNNHMAWLKDRAGDERINPSSIRSVKGLLEALIRVASSHVLVLHSEGSVFTVKTNGPTILIRLHPEFCQLIANLHALVLDHKLKHITYDLRDLEHAWIVQYLFHHDDFSTAKSYLCISGESVWVECSVRSGYGDYEEQRQVKTASVPVASIAPVELLQPRDVNLPTCLDIEKSHLSKERLTAFLDAERAYDILSAAVYQSERLENPPESLVLFEKLCLAPGDRGQLTQVRDMNRRLQTDVERWEAIMEQEREDFCKEALGIERGDIILSELNGKPVRIRADRLYAYFSDNGDINLHVHGRRYRKDGVLGKREDSLYLKLQPKTLR